MVLVSVVVVVDVASKLVVEFEISVMFCSGRIGVFSEDFDDTKNFG